MPGEVGYPCEHSLVGRGGPPAVPHYDMAASLFSYDDALEWISAHSMSNSSRFSKSAKRLGDEVIPAMLQVVAEASLRYVTPAMIVLGYHGVTVVGSGNSASEYRYRITMPDGTESTLVPTNLCDADFSESEDAKPESVQSDEIVTEGSITKTWLNFLGWLLIGGVIAFFASRTSGALSLVLTLLAGVILLFAVSSTLLFGATLEFLRIRKKRRRLG
jgi:hypothetical protein